MYRVAELMEGRAAQFRDDLVAHGYSKSEATEEVAASIDRLVWFAGWPDKIPAVLGGTNPVASSHFVFTIPEPTGVVAIIAPESSPLLGSMLLASRAVRTARRIGGTRSQGSVASALTA
jgi:acyl-CoA reductase-like NAD-dependent aldehyde dehydrogenase